MTGPTGPDRTVERNTEGPNSTSPFPVAFALGLTLLLSFLAYSKTLAFGFVYDDRAQVVGNAYLRSWHYVSRFFTTQVWNFYDPNSAGNYYRPLFLLWLLINRTLFGFRPPLWHLTNILLHVVATAFAFLIVRELAQDDVAAIIASLVFGLHPVHIESVAWISGDTDTLTAIGLFASFWAYLRWRRTSRKGWLFCSLACYAAGILAKETALVLPIIILAYAWLWEAPVGDAAWLARWRQQLLRWFVLLLPFGVLTAAYLAVRWRVLHGLSHAGTPLSLATIAMTWPSILVVYVKHLVWPFGLNPFNDVPYVTRPSLGLLVLPLAILAAIAGLLYVWARRVKTRSPLQVRLIAFSCVWLVAPLLPVADLSVFPKDYFCSDRYLYISVLGLAILIAAGVRHLMPAGRAVFGLPAAQWGATFAMAAVLGTATSVQGQYWSNDLMFYSRGVATFPDNDGLRTNLANVLGERGQYNEAIRLYQYVLERKPYDWWANYNLGYTDYKVGRLASAEKYLKRAIAINQLHGDQYFYLGLTELKLNRVQQAKQFFRTAIRIDPQGFAYHLALGLVLKLENQPAAALREFQTELANYPSEAAAAGQISVTEKLVHGDSGRASSSGGLR